MSRSICTLASHGRGRLSDNVTPLANKPRQLTIPMGSSYTMFEGGHKESVMSILLISDFGECAGVHVHVAFSHPADEVFSAISHPRLSTTC